MPHYENTPAGGHSGTSTCRDAVPTDGLYEVVMPTTPGINDNNTALDERKSKKQEGPLYFKSALMIFLLLSILAVSIACLIITIQKKEPWLDVTKQSKQAEKDMHDTLNRTEQNQMKMIVESMEKMRFERKLTAMIAESVEKLGFDMNSSQAQMKTSINRNSALLDTLMSGWYRASNNMWYKIFKEANYTEAREQCKALGADIITKGLRSGVVFRELTEKVLDTTKVGCKTWIGLEYLKDNWAWVDGGQKSLFVKWNKGEPNDQGCRSAHISTFEGNSKAMINDASCKYHCPYTCEKVY